MSEEKPAETPKPPQDDGLKSRKFLSAAISVGVVFFVASLVLMCGVLDVRGAADSLVKMGFSFDDWTGLVKTLVGFLVIGYGAVNVSEKWTLTR